MYINKVNIYTDGAFNNNLCKWAFVVIDGNNKIKYSKSGILYGEITKMRQVGGELHAVKEAILYCKQNNVQCSIFYDYTGVFDWIADLFGKKKWKAKNPWTKEYRRFIIENKQFIYSFHKVKSHSGDKFNEVVDSLASGA